MRYTGRVADGLRWGLGAVAPIEIGRSSIISSEIWVYISESQSGDLMINRKVTDSLEMIHENSNKYEDRDGYFIKEYPDKVKITVSNPRKVGEYNFYPIFEVEIEIEAIPDEDSEEE